MMLYYLPLAHAFSLCEGECPVFASEFIEEQRRTLYSLFISVLYSMHSLCILYAPFSLVSTLHTLQSRHCFWRQVSASLSSLWPSGLLLHDSDGLDFYENESRASRLVDFVQKHVKIVQV